jgi:hypothetical protein
MASVLAGLVSGWSEKAQHLDPAPASPHVVVLADGLWAAQPGASSLPPQAAQSGTLFWRLCICVVGIDWQEVLQLCCLLRVAVGMRQGVAACSRRTQRRRPGRLEPLLLPRHEVVSAQATSVRHGLTVLTLA